MKGYSTLLRTQMQFNVIARKPLLGSVLPLDKGYSERILSHVDMVIKGMCTKLSKVQ